MTNEQRMYLAKFRLLIDDCFEAVCDYTIALGIDGPVPDERILNEVVKRWESAVNAVNELKATKNKIDIAKTN